LHRCKDKLWLAPQPDATAKILEKHAEWWTVAVHFSDGFPLPDKVESDPEAKQLLNAGVTHVGGWTRFRGFRDASFAHDEFLKFMRNKDPAYAEAIRQVVHES
jgi:hypothetical protein